MIRVRKKITVIFLQPSKSSFMARHGACRAKISPRGVQIGDQRADQDDAEQAPPAVHVLHDEKLGSAIGYRARRTPMKSLVIAGLLSALLIGHANAQVYYTYAEWERLSDQARTMYIAGAYDSLISITSPDTVPIARHYAKCVSGRVPGSNNLRKTSAHSWPRARICKKGRCRSG
jgi:hypothetical protein